MTTDKTSWIEPGARKVLFCTLALCVLAGCRNQEVPQATTTGKASPPAEQDVRNQPPAPQKEEQLPKDIADEIIGRWKIVRNDACGAVGMDDVEANWYIGKTVSIEPGQMVFKNHKGKERVCRYADIKATVEDTEDYLAKATTCAPDFKEFVKIKEIKIKVFRPEPPTCSGTPFVDFFKPNSKTLVIQWNLVFFFMERDENGTAGSSSRVGSGNNEVAEFK